MGKFCRKKRIFVRFFFRGEIGKGPLLDLKICQKKLGGFGNSNFETQFVGVSDSLGKVSDQCLCLEGSDDLPSFEQHILENQGCRKLSPIDFRKTIRHRYC